MSEQSSVCKGAGYDEVFQSGHEADEGFSQSSERGTSVRSPNDNAESYDKEVEEKKESNGKDEGDDGAVDKDEGGVSKEGSSEVTGMVILVHLFSPKYGSLMTLCRR